MAKFWRVLLFSSVSLDFIMPVIMLAFSEKSSLHIFRVFFCVSWCSEYSLKVHIGACYEPFLCLFYWCSFQPVFTFHLCCIELEYWYFLAYLGVQSEYSLKVHIMLELSMKLFYACSIGAAFSVNFYVSSLLFWLGIVIFSRVSWCSGYSLKDHIGAFYEPLICLFYWCSVSISFLVWYLVFWTGIFVDETSLKIERRRNYI